MSEGGKVMSTYSIYENRRNKVASVTYDASDDLAIRAEIISPRGERRGYTEPRILAMVTVFDSAGNEKGFGKVSMPRSGANIHGLISNFHLFERDNAVGGVMDYEFIKEATDLLDIVPSVTKGRVVKEETSDVEQYIRNGMHQRHGSAADDRGIQLAIDTAIHNQIIMAGSSVWVLDLLR